MLKLRRMSPRFMKYALLQARNSTLAAIKKIYNSFGLHVDLSELKVVMLLNSVIKVGEPWKMLECKSYWRVNALLLDLTVFIKRATRYAE